MSFDNGYPVRGLLQCIKEGSETIDEVERTINIIIERSTEKGYAEGVRDEMARWGRSSQRAENTVPRGLTEEEVQMDQLKRLSAYKQGVHE